MVAIRFPKPMLVLLLGASIAQAGSFLVTGPADVSFRGKAVGLNLVGKSDDLSLLDDGTSLVFDVKLDTFKTGIELRDRHMTEKYLETGKFPKATLKLDKAKLTLPASGSQKGKTTGLLTVRGKTKEVPVTYEVKREAGLYKVKANLPMDYRDYDIAVPSYAGVTVKPELTIEVMQRAVALGLVAFDGAEVVVDPTFLDVGSTLVAMGFPVQEVLDEYEQLNSVATDLAGRFTALFERHLWQPFADAGMPEARLSALTDDLARLTPLAETITAAVLRRALSAAAAGFLADQAAAHPALESDQ